MPYFGLRLNVIEIRKFKKILIANRGEIACRIIWTCKEMGIKTVAVHSDVDRDSLHVRYADEAACIGPAPSAQSYLNIPCHHQHRRDLQRRCDSSGLRVPGRVVLLRRDLRRVQHQVHWTAANIIRLMGDKIEARRAMQRLGCRSFPAVRMGLLPKMKVSGTRSRDRISGHRQSFCRRRWTRHAHRASEEELGKALEAASTEAAAAFKDGSVYIERYIEQPRHIEIQVLADEYGDCIHLGERECSIQRRHQKLMEEAPSTF